MLYQENPLALADTLEACGARYTFQTLAGVGHATYTLGEAAACPIAEFFRMAFTE